MKKWKMLDYFETKPYDNSGDNMKNFMQHDFTIEKIELACFVKAGTGMPVHRNRASHGIAVFLDGDITISFDNKKVGVTKNTVVYFPKGSNYTIKNKKASDCYCINFQMADGTAFEPFGFKIKNIGSYLESFRQSQKIWSKKTIGYSAKVKAELYQIIYNLQSEYGLPYGNASVIEPAVEYIHSHYDKAGISVACLAELCGISTVHLRNTFVKNFGMPPVQYIINLKLARAKELLTSQMYTVSEVCFLSGFQDESYFSREFKKHFHIPPSEYAKRTATE